MSTLKDFYNGNISPSEKYIKKNSQYYNINNEIMLNIDKLCISLNSQEKDLLKKIEENSIALCSICEEESCIDGFCTGVKMILEIMNYKSKNFI